MLWGTLGPAFWAGIGVIFALLPLSGVLSAFLVKLQGQLMTAKDARVSRTSEALGAMKLLKACGWERGFGARVTAARTAELRVLQSAVGFEMGFGVLWEAIPLLVAMVAFLAFSARGGILTAARVFTSLALFDVIRFPLLVLPEIVTQIANTAVSLKRLQAFLEAEELPRPHHRAKTRDDVAASADEAAAEVLSADLAWEAGGAAVLSDVTVRVAPGELVCVLGAVGSGKSTLLSSLLGELPPIRGVSRLRPGARVAFCSQTPFVVAGTVRDNVLFGAPYDAATYDTALRCACLGPDLDALPAGDATRVGENGVTLSGGQRQRLALARAAYRTDADVVLLDDPLSALDASVGRAVFDALLGPAGALAARGAARLLVTHGAQYLPDAHRLVLLRDGRVAAQADFATMAAGGADSPLAELMQLYGEDVAAVAAVADSAHAATSSHDATTPHHASDAVSAPVAASVKVDVPDADAKDGASQGGVGAAEGRQEGRVDASVYFYYLKAAGLTQSGGVLALFAAWTALLAGSKLWLARWAAAGGVFSARWAGGYGAIGAAALVVLLSRQALRTHSQVRGGRRLHEALLAGVLRARLSFFTATPAGRVLNRFAGDAAVADERLHDDACDALRQSCAVVAAAAVVGAVTPPLLLGLPPLALAFAAVQRRYAASARELQRLESVARSPIFSGVSEALAGAATIRAYGERRRFERQHRDALAAQLRAYFACQSANRWLALRTEGIAAAVVVAAAAAALRSGSRVAPGLAGLSISYAMLVCNALSWLVRATSMVETEIVSVERMKEFAELQPEPPLVIADSRPPQGWPRLGAIALEAVSLRYAPGLPRVLDAVSLRVAGGEKLGVVGRTGAGKSSLLLALLRLTDAELMEGRICIDDVDTATIGVGDLRSAVAVIPQEGTLFAGTLRFNLDPLGTCDDGKLGAALSLVGLGAWPLDADVAEEGGNWSAGQRQLLCLARAALRSSRVVLCDEATSSCDAATDALMQAAMRRAFADATVLTVAHRIGTVLACDRVLVMHGGKAAELDAPGALATRPGGIFAALLAESRRREAHDGGTETQE
jgi:ABC-type multidrug transport system fused ATPase/permease subunit